MRVPSPGASVHELAPCSASHGAPASSAIELARRICEAPAPASLAVSCAVTCARAVIVALPRPSASVPCSESVPVGAVVSRVVLACTVALVFPARSRNCTVTSFAPSPGVSVADRSGRAATNAPTPPGRPSTAASAPDSRTSSAPEEGVRIVTAVVAVKGPGAIEGVPAVGVVVSSRSTRAGATAVLPARSRKVARSRFSPSGPESAPVHDVAYGEKPAGPPLTGPDNSTSKAPTAESASTRPSCAAAAASTTPFGAAGDVSASVALEGGVVSSSIVSGGSVTALPAPSRKRTWSCFRPSPGGRNQGRSDTKGSHTAPRKPGSLESESCRKSG